MIKFTNKDKTAAEFNGTFFQLDGPENWASIGDGPTREAVLAWLAEGNVPEAYIEPPAPPITVTPWQFRKALNQLLLRDQVEQAVTGSTDKEMQDGWEFASSFVRDDPFVVSMGQALGKADAEMDQLFELAQTL
jgi:hypothetical protein